MELRHLRYFISVAEERNIGRAAERLHMTQPPLTRQISQLERELDTQLFNRTAKGVELTNAGRVFLEDARRVVEMADQAGDRAQRAGRGLAGRIDIAVFGTGVFGVIPVLLRSVRDKNPDVKIWLHDMNKQDQLEALADRRISLAFNRFIPPTEGVASEPLVTERLHVALPEDHPLAERAEIRPSDLEGQPMVLFPTGIRPSFIDVVEEICRNAGFSPTVAAEVGSVVHGMALVATGAGVCFVTGSATNLHLPGVVYRPLVEASRSEIELCCIYRSDDPSPLLARLVDSLREAATEHFPESALG
ncbi:MAG: LysR family transcriptional regulator [Acidimicrobiales bacterium]